MLTSAVESLSAVSFQGYPSKISSPYRRGVENLGMEQGYACRANSGTYGFSHRAQDLGSASGGGACGTTGGDQPHNGAERASVSKAKSASTIMLTNRVKLILGFQPNSLSALELSPRNEPVSVGLKKRGSTTT